MRNYDDDWSDDQRGLYDESYDIGEAWAKDPDTSSDELQDVINMAEADDDELGDMELTHPALVDAVANATGELQDSITADRDDPAFRGFTDGVRDGAEADVFGL
ncbi:hypothetical protein AB0J86_31535 [Micromonospora sp. NPDC049559]|uniref:hypothetical protein n=1 Tax=Micromonospora sp. NPDC049559 TaxID=3155923 RepID=UPI0034288421